MAHTYHLLIIIPNYTHHYMALLLPAVDKVVGRLCFHRSICPWGGRVRVSVVPGPFLVPCPFRAGMACLVQCPFYGDRVYYWNTFLLDKCLRLYPPVPAFFTPMISACGSLFALPLIQPKKITFKFLFRF